MLNILSPVSSTERIQDEAFLNLAGTRGRFATLAVLLLIASSAASAEQVNFNRDIRPLLSNKCFQCHGPDVETREADLRLDTEVGATADLGDYRAVDREKPDESELIHRITSDDPDMRMPPVDSGKELSPDEIKLIKQWIGEGAVWSRHWAYVPPHVVEPPQVHDTDWPLNWVDQFVLAKLEKLNLRPSPPTDRVTLIRRLSFDLTGLPPTPQEVDAFVPSDDPKTYEKLVDRLLDSPRFGERLAIYWLDLVRYADTVGYHGDQDHNIAPYRDYVINAFNDNMPFDQFTIEQLAGDLLPAPTLDQLVATGYNRLLQTTHEGGLQPDEYRAIYAADRVRNVSNVWLGGTLGCAQCHDHKFDPYTSKDFYSMAAFFADIDDNAHFKNGTNNLPTRRDPEIDVLPHDVRDDFAKISQQLTGLQNQIDAIVSEYPELKREEQESRQAAKDSSEDSAPENDAASAACAPPGIVEQHRQLRTDLANLARQRDKLQACARRTMITKSLDEPRITRLLPRGNWLDETGPVMQPAVPEFLGKITSDERATRLDLARWITDAEQGVGLLTARVMANRLWYLAFGNGISESLDDFGGQGKPPVHPELLDNLAVEFVRSGWDIKHMVKLLVMSRAYRQSSLSTPVLDQRDPYNQLIARQSRYRLPAEMVRDNALAVSGLLVIKSEGKSIKPYQPAGYYRHLNFPQRRYKYDSDDRQWQRGVFVHWQRQFLHPMLKALDAPSREECTARRPRSNTPLAALVLLNDPSFVEAARVFAARIMTEAGESFDERLDLAFRYAVSRLPDNRERAVLNAFLEAAQTKYSADTAAAKQLVSSGLAPAADLDLTQHAAWTSVARAILNLSETMSRN